jgi:hypothetical protein
MAGTTHEAAVGVGPFVFLVPVIGWRHRHRCKVRFAGVLMLVEQNRGYRMSPKDKMDVEQDVEQDRQEFGGSKRSV